MTLHDSIQLHRFSLPDYERMGELGLLAARQTRFCDGLVWEIVPAADNELAAASDRGGTLTTARPRTAEQLARWSCDDYYRMGQAGLFAGRRVELYEGVVVMMSPLGKPHIAVVLRIGKRLRTAFGDRYLVREQCSFLVAPGSELQPDVAVVQGNEVDYLRDHPSSADLIVEVAETSLAYDRHNKLPQYAAAAVAEYWIANLVDNCLEVFRSPQPDTARPGQFTYAEQRVFKPGEEIAPLHAPDALLSVADLLLSDAPQ